MITRGGIHWVDNIHWVDSGDTTPGDHRPAKRRPVLVIQADAFNASRLPTVVVVAITSNLARAGLPGNVLLPAAESGLPRDSVIAVTEAVTLNRYELEDPAAGRMPPHLMTQVDAGLGLALGLAPSAPAA
ncbi:type II toxin-antitoxin system PemK/MazF family toxin [Serinibacter salmoneus]|uniref:mRNA interferase MazF n=1 Tax=Serinibacter salmoneus TaxID=556530 RepID=A0A2A9D350_9MICO|nr:type II toxin-antitoxin system PemK/MazF family toxin [Serinibacter salmoneus]PFG20675.1 mRNA interferase MazF [Serinibacter salmoneus]